MVWMMNRCAPRHAGSSHSTGYGLAPRRGSSKKEIADAVWTFALGFAGLLLAVGLTYAAMSLGLGAAI